MATSIQDIFGSAAFDSGKEEKMQEFQCLPVGWYKVFINKDEIKQSKSTPTKYLQFNLQVIEGEYKSAPVIDRVFMQAASDEGKAFARRKLASICEACGKKVIKNTTELLRVPFMVKLAVEANDNPQFEDSNVIKQYESIASYNSKYANGETVANDETSPTEDEPIKVKFSAVPTADESDDTESDDEPATKAKPWE